MNANLIKIDNFKSEVGMKLEMLLDIISEHKIDVRATKNEHLDSIVIPDIREIRLAVGVKKSLKEVVDIQRNIRDEKAKTEDVIDAIYKKAIFMLNEFEEELSELLSELSSEEGVE